MQARFPEQPLVSLRDMGVGGCGIYAAGAEGVSGGLADLGSMAVVRIASEYPNLAEAFAMAARLSAYRVQAVWGAAEAYPPEDADIAVVAAADEGALRAQGLRPLFCLLESSAWLIANAGSLANKDLSAVLGPLIGGAPTKGRVSGLRLPPPLPAVKAKAGPSPQRQVVRMALPDGHQQRHVVDALRAAGLSFEGYDESRPVRRPTSPVDGLAVKVIRPHDMPQLVATGEMDLAVTGRDCLMEHLYRFPSSPVAEILDLQRGRFNMSAVVSEELHPGFTIPFCAYVCHMFQGKVIEGLDLKSYGFDLEASRIEDPERFNRLLLGLTLAYGWAVRIGHWLDQSGQRLLVDRGRTPKQSAYRLGRYWLIHLWSLGSDEIEKVHFAKVPT
jgi:ATP phosphoribosyltransferase